MVDFAKHLRKPIPIAENPHAPMNCRRCTYYYEERGRIGAIPEYGHCTEEWRDPMSYDFTPLCTEYCQCGHADYKHSLAVSPNFGYWKCRVKKCHCLKFKHNPQKEDNP